MATSCWEASLFTRAGTRSSALPQWNSTLLNSGHGTTASQGTKDTLPPQGLPGVLRSLARNALGKPVV